jgi:phage-related protein
MASEDVKIKVSLDGADQVSKGLNGIGDSADKSDSKVSKLVSGGLKGAGTALLGFATAAVAAGGALAAGVLNQSAQYEQNIGGIETMFGTAASKMEKYAADAYKTAGLSSNEYMSQVTSFSAALLQGLGGDTNKAADVANRAMTDMSDNANKFGSNIGDIQNAYQGFAKQNFTMLDNLKLGYGGTASEMARLVNDSGVMGSSFTATAQNINSVSYDKIIAAIGKVQDKMGITGTTAKEAASTISGSVDSMKGAWANLLAGLGRSDADVAALSANVIDSLQTVLKNVTPVITNIGNNIATLGPKLGEMAQSLISAVASAIPAVLSAGVALVTGLLQGIISALPSLVTALVPGVVQMISSLATILPLLVTAGGQAVAALVQGLAAAAPTLIPTIIQGIMGMIQALVDVLPMLLQAGLQLVIGLVQGLLAAIPVLVAALPQLITSILNFIVSAIPMLIQAGIQLLTALITALPTIITTIVSVLPQIIQSIVTAVIGAIPMLIQAGISLLTALIKALPTIINTIVAALPKIIVAIVNALANAIPQLINAGIQLITAIVKNLPAIIAGIVKAVPAIITGLVNAIVKSAPQLAAAGLNLVQGLWQGISNATSWLMGMVGGWVDGIVGGIKGLLGIHSPSTVMAEIGKYTVQGFAKGIKGTAYQATQAVDSLTKKIRDAMSKKIISKSRGNAAIDDINTQTKKIQKAITDRSKVLDKLKDAQDKLAAIQKQRTDKISSVQGSVVGSVDVADYKTLDEAKKAMKDQIAAVAAFKKKLDTLQKEGLDDTSRDSLLNQFLQNGDTTMADQLLAGGKSAVKEFAGLQSQLSAQGKSLGTLVANDMYNAGIQTAAGLVKGLQSQQKNLDKVAQSLAASLVKSVKKELKIKSPSQVFRDEIGKMIPAGIGVGVDQSASLAIQPVQSLTTQLVTTAQTGLTPASMPMSLTATPTQNGPINVEAALDTDALTNSIIQGMNSMKVDPAAQATVSDASIKKMTVAIVNAIRVQSRQGVSVLG